MGNDNDTLHKQCLDCSGLKARIHDLESRSKSIDDSIIDLWRAVNSKIGIWWIALLVPIFIVWLSFQGAMYDGIKNIQKDVAVIQTTLKLRGSNEPIRNEQVLPNRKNSIR